MGVKRLSNMTMKQYVNDNIIRDYDIVLDAEFGAPGTTERAKAEDKAYSFYSGQILRKARVAEKVTQVIL